MSNLTVVVAGIPALTTALEGSGRFSRVVSVDSTSGLKRLLQSGTLSAGVDDKVFVFSDSTPVDTPQTLGFLVGKLTAMGSPVMVVATSPGARDLVAQCPGAGLLEGPLKLNQVLGALSGMPKLPQLEPVANNVDIALPGIDHAPVSAPAAPAAPAPVAPAVPAAPFGVAAPAFPSAAPAFGQGAPAAPVVPAPAPAQAPAQSPAQSPASPAFPEQPAANPFSAPEAPFVPAPAPQQPAFQDAPAFQGGAPAFPGGPTPAAEEMPARRKSLSDVGVGAAAPEAPAFGFGQQVESAQQAPAFATPAAQPSASPFGQVPQGGAASPFGQPAAPGVGLDQPPAGWGAQAPAAAAVPGAPAPRTGTLGGTLVGVAQPERPVRRGHVTTVTAPKGGTGKSTLSLNLAAYLGLRLRGTGKNVCIIDANVQQADTGKYLNAYTPNIEGVLKDVSAIHPDRINNYLLHKPELNLSALLGPATPEVANPLYFTGRRYTQILEALKPNFDYIIIDTPVAELYHDLFREFALPQADFIATTIAPNVATLMNTDSWLRQITAPRNADGMGIDRDKIGIVLNRAQEDIGLSEEEVRRELGEWRFLGSIPETKEWQRCNNRGELVATKNYHELNEAFSVVLAAATGEELLMTTPAALTPPKRGAGGLVSGLVSKLKKKG